MSRLKAGETCGISLLPTADGAAAETSALGWFIWGWLVFGTSEAEAFANAEGLTKGDWIGCETTDDGREGVDDSSSLWMRGGGEVKMGGVIVGAGIMNGCLSSKSLLKMAGGAFVLGRLGC